MTETLKPKLNFEPQEDGGLFSFSYQPKSSDEELEIKLLVEYPSIKPSPNGFSRPTVKRAKADFTNYKHKGAKYFHLEAADAVIQLLKNAERFQKDQEVEGFWQAWADCLGTKTLTPATDPVVTEKDFETHVEFQAKHKPAGDDYDKTITLKVYKPRIEWREVTQNVFFSEQELSSPFFDTKELPTHNEPILHRAYVDLGGYLCFDPEVTAIVVSLITRASELQSEWESEVFWKAWEKTRSTWSESQETRTQEHDDFHKTWQENVGEKQKRYELYLELKEEFQNVMAKRPLNTHASSPVSRW